MQLGNTQEYAKLLLELYGGKAEADAAQKAKEFEEAGDSEKAELWMKIRAAIKEMRGPHVS